MPGALERAFEERLRRKTFFPRVQEFLETQPPFLRDTELVVHFRTYYLDRDNLDGTENQAWAAGGWLQYRSGWLLNTFQLGATLYTSQPLYAPEDKDGTGLLAPGQEGYTVLGEAYGALRYGDQRLTGYRQQLDLPYVNGDDSRMTPNTFQGVTPAVLSGAPTRPERRARSSARTAPGRLAGPAPAAVARASPPGPPAGRDTFVWA